MQASSSVSLAKAKQWRWRSECEREGVGEGDLFLVKKFQLVKNLFSYLIVLRRAYFCP